MKEYKSIVETLEAHGVPSTQGAIMAVKECIDAEVEKRIKERMPSDEDIRLEFPIGGTFKMRYNSDYAESIKENQSKRLGAFWLRSRLTNPGEQKTEGGTK